MEGGKGERAEKKRKKKEEKYNKGGETKITGARPLHLRRAECCSLSWGSSNGILFCSFIFEKTNRHGCSSFFLFFFLTENVTIKFKKNKK
jgi:hypothetical protein